MPDAIHNSWFKNKLIVLCFISDIQLNNPKITIVINTCHETFIGKLVPVIPSQLSYPFRHNFPLPLGISIPDLKMNTLVNLRPFAPFNIKHQHLNIWAKQDYLCIIILISVLIICLISPVSPDNRDRKNQCTILHGLIYLNYVPGIVEKHHQRTTPETYDHLQSDGLTWLIPSNNIHNFWQCFYNY